MSHVSSTRLRPVAWVVGASSGIGWHLVLELARRGYAVAASARRQDRLEELAAAATGPVLAVPCDVRDRAGMEAAYQRVRAKLGVPDLVVLNAGDYRPMPAREFDPKLFRHLMEVNYLGVVHGVAAVLDDLLAAGRGQVLATASVSGYRGLPLAAPYGATKAAVIHLMESLNAELGGSGVRFRVINPGFVRSPLTAKNDFPMPLLMEPEDAARRIVRALDGGAFEIAFPRRLAWGLKLLRCLPYWLYFPLVRRGTGV